MKPLYILGLLASAATAKTEPTAVASSTVTGDTTACKGPDSWPAPEGSNSGNKSSVAFSNDDDANNSAASSSSPATSDVAGIDNNGSGFSQDSDGLPHGWNGTMFNGNGTFFLSQATNSLATVFGKVAVGAALITLASIY